MFDDLFFYFGCLVFFIFGWLVSSEYITGIYL